VSVNRNQPRRPKGTPVGGQWDRFAGGGPAVARLDDDPLFTTIFVDDGIAEVEMGDCENLDDVLKHYNDPNHEIRTLRLKDPLGNEVLVPVRVLASARKRGYSNDDIFTVLANYHRFHRREDDLDMYVGFNLSSVEIEVGVANDNPKEYRAVHAMPVRLKYAPTKPSSKAKRRY